MGIIIDIMDRVKYRLGKADEPAPPRQDDSVNDTAAGEEDSSGNPILDLYNRAVTHPVTTIGLIAAVVGVGAAAAFVLAERQAQKGIERELARKSARAGAKLKKRLYKLGEEDVMPRVKDYRRKAKRKLRRWL